MGELNHLSQEELNYLATYGYIDALKTYTNQDVQLLCKSVGLPTSRYKYVNIQRLQDYQNSLQKEESIWTTHSNFVLK